NFVRIDFRSTQRRFVLKELFAFNRNVLLEGDRLLPDTDADGLSDEQEIALGTDPRSEDSDGDNFNDKLEHVLRTLGTDPTRTTLRRGASSRTECTSRTSARPRTSARATTSASPTSPWWTRSTAASGQGSTTSTSTSARSPKARSRATASSTSRRYAYNIFHP